MMRGSLRRLMPIFALALLVQWLAPIGAFRFVAQAIADPTAVAPLCTGMAPAENNAAGPIPSPHKGGCCAICAVGIGGAPLGPDAPQDFNLVRAYAPLAWLPADQAAPRGRQIVRPNARGPPARA